MSDLVYTRCPPPEICCTPDSLLLVLHYAAPQGSIYRNFAAPPPDDVMFSGCVINGRAIHLVSYDRQLRSLRSFYKHGCEDVSEREHAIAEAELNLEGETAWPQIPMPRG